MRHISTANLRRLIKKLVTPKYKSGITWEAKATAALADVKKVFDASPTDLAVRTKNKSECIDKHAQVWRDVKPALAELSSGKCWYCETLLTRAFGEVEHFRPKKLVTSHPKHEGYWWLSFDIKNLRLSCEKCNKKITDSEGIVGGKANYFELVDEDNRVYSFSFPIDREGPMLIDPISPHEPGWLYFSQDGRVEPQPYLNGKLRDRVTESIIVFHLDDPDLKELREDLYSALEKLVDSADYLFQQMNSTADDNAIIGYELACYTLQRMMNADAEYSAAVRCMLMGLRGNKLPWIDGILQTA